MRLALLFGFIPILVIYANDGSCRTSCYKDRIPMCGSWLIDDNADISQGTYQLNKGELNLTCSMSSIPEPLEIEWMFRPEQGTTWEPVKCSSLKNVVKCRANKVGEHRVYSTCLVKTDSLVLTGRYRCQAAEKSTNNDLVLSSESAVTVVGIERFHVVERSLIQGESGFIEIEICANPKPEIVWITSGGVLQQGSDNARLTALQLIKLKVCPSY
ncbi:hypothetical protein AB6A40_010293 [Gnathostoma spinigerum]|uniref:Ig-like domain-containing protein n=1 Tax=Gnathostoma spinigerum TaxID=75299 RepID=A0ABD6F194_9BILA